MKIACKCSPITAKQKQKTAFKIIKREKLIAYNLTARNY